MLDKGLSAARPLRRKMPQRFCVNRPDLPVKFSGQSSQWIFAEGHLGLPAPK
jgi:hypothetical protein